MSETDLISRLVQLLREADHSNLRLLLAGGLGVVLRVGLARAVGEPTLGAPPVARTTLDIDVLLGPEVIVEQERMRQLRAVLERLGYGPVEGAEYYQWIAVDGIKIDLQVETPTGEFDLKVDSRRVRPAGFSGLHAHRLDEALGSDLQPVPVPLTGTGLVARADDTPMIVVNTPNLFSYWSMKLLALRDNARMEEDDFGRRHAFDMYALWASATKQIWGDAERVASATAGAGIRPRLEQAAATLFESPDGLGRIRVKEALRDAGEEHTDAVDSMATDLLQLFATDTE